MEAETATKVSALCGEIETTDAVGSESHNNRKDYVGSSSKNQEKDFELLDSVYSAAESGDINKFRQHTDVIDQILTPNGNTILHIHIIARPIRIFNQEETLDLEKNDDFVRKMLGMCPALLVKANKKGETLLHMAARHGHADVAKFLLNESNKNYDLEHGISARQMLQMINEAKDTALHEAVRYGHLDVVKILIQEDPCLTYEANTADETPVYLAAERQHAEVLKAILEICDSPADGGPCGRTALHMAVFRNDEEITTLLLAKESICNSKQDQHGWTPLHFAADFGYIEILKKLLTKDKCAAYMADKEGKTALHVAAAGGRVQIVEELLSTCPGCWELVDNRGWNVLHFAFTEENRNQEAIVSLVLKNSSVRHLVNEKDKNGNTPFLQAAYVDRITDFIFGDDHQVDKLVFNHHNQNAMDIISANKSGLLVFRNLSLWWLEKHKVSPGMRTRVSENDDDKSKSQEGQAKDEVNTEGSESRDGKDMRAVIFANKRIDNNLLAATLIATVSFAAGITIPGGFISDKGPHQGTAILTGNAAFRAFVLLNTMSLFLSSLAVFFHLYESNFPVTTIRLKHLLGVMVGKSLTSLAMMAMIGAFLSGTLAVLQSPDTYLAIGGSIAVLLLLFLLLAFYNFELMYTAMYKKM